ncbi:polysaccharide deacetylase family protein [Streptomyces sp. NPDC001848]|uniref:polysaccharide deacetylase family protein n=1 Tax=Streptomyces sp. NPDC001848 TaxID=3364618 RepID=UPI003693484A
MKKDQLLSRRRMLLAGAAALGAAGAAGWAGLLLDDDPVRPARGALGVSGPGARTRQKASTFRLRPMTGYGPARRTPARTAVRREPILRMAGRGRSMVLTFDDGPDRHYTPGILRTLREYDVRAMFFVCGEMAADHKDLLREMADDGHIVGNHTWTHPLLTRLTRPEIRAEMERTCEIVQDAYGEAPLWFRAPYGAWNRATFELGAELGMEPLAWTLDSGDWTTPPPDAKAIVEQVEGGAAPGVVVLSHDAGGDRSQTVAALRDWLPFLLDAGYHLTVPRRRFG